MRWDEGTRGSRHPAWGGGVETGDEKGCGKPSDEEQLMLDYTQGIEMTPKKRKKKLPRIDLVPITKKGRDWNCGLRWRARIPKVYRAGTDDGWRGYFTKRAGVAWLSFWIREKDLACTVRIHKKDGTFQEERTFPRSADPKRSKG